MTLCHSARPARRIRRKRPFVIGLTGSIGMGKSAVTRMFRMHGVPGFDADLAVRQVQAPGGSALAPIEGAFPGVVRDGVLDRQELGRRVFDNVPARTQLEAIVHPLVHARQQDFLRRNRHRRVVLLDVPLLLEGDGWRKCDMVVVVSAPLHVQRARVLRRPGMTQARFEAILATQMPDALKRARADVVIETGRGRLLTWRSVAKVARFAKAAA
ncbi:MAG: dephospho-CoA kinase [Sphingomonadaceae bacterium]